MVEQHDNRSVHAWSYLWSILGSLTASLILTVLPKAIGAAGTFGRVVASVPIWISFPLTFLAALGLITVFQVLFAFVRGRPALLQTETFGAPARSKLRHNDVEIDLRSIAPLVVLFSTQMPAIAMTLRVTNHSAYTLTVTHLKVSVWFSQPTTELTLDAPFEVEAHSTRDDIFLRKLLEDSATKYIKAFFDRDDFAKFIAIDVTTSGTSDAGPFQTGRHFDLRSHDIQGVLR